MNDQEKRAQIERVFTAINDRNMDEIRAIFHPDYLDHTPMGEVHGPQAFCDFLQTWYTAFPDAHFETRNLILDGDWAAWQVRFTGTNTGSMMGMPPTGRAVDTLGVHMGRLAPDGPPVEHWTGNDMSLLMQQLGLMPDMSGAPAA